METPTRVSAEEAEIFCLADRFQTPGTGYLYFLKDVAICQIDLGGAQKKTARCGEWLSDYMDLSIAQTALGNLRNGLLRAPHLLPRIAGEEGELAISFIIVSILSPRIA